MLILRDRLLPFWVQAPSPKPPVESKSQARIFFPTGSHPIHTVASPTKTSFAAVVNEATIKFWFSVHSNESRSTSPVSVVPVHSPMAHSRPRRCSALAGGTKGESRTLSRYHLPSFF